MYLEHVATSTRNHPLRSSYPLVLFALLALVLVSVFLLAPITVTLDGYSHLYGANVLREMLGGNPEVHRYFSYNSLLLPNWICPLFLAALSSILPYELALKAQIVLLGILLLSSLYFCVDVTPYQRRQRAQILILLLPFALNGFVTLGFYGFLMSASMCVFVLGLILRHGLRMSLRLQLLTAFLLLAAYFSNPLPVLLSLLFPATHFVAEAIIHRRDGLRRVVFALKRCIFCSWPWVPPICLILWFYLRLTHATKPYGFSVVNTLKRHAIALARDAVLSISPTPSVGTLFIVLLGILSASLFLRPRQLSEKQRFRYTFLAALSVSTLVFYLLVPDSVGEGSWVPARFLWYSAFSLILLAVTIGSSGERVLTLCSLVATLSVIGFAGEYALVSNILAPAMADLRMATEKAPRHSRVLILAYRMTPSCQGSPLLERTLPEYHLALASTLKNQLIVLNDYEARSSVFPLRYSGTRSFAATENDGWSTFEEKRAAWSEVLNSDTGADFVLSWGTPSGPTYCTNPVAPPFEEALRIKHDLVFFTKGASCVQLWRKRG